MFELIPLQEPIATTQTTTNSSQEGKVTEEATTETEELSAKQITEGSEVINEEPKATEKITTIIQTPTAKTEEPEPIANTQTTSNPTKQKSKEMVIPVKPDKFRPIEQPANSQDSEENHTQKKPKQTSQSSWLSTLTHAAASVVKTVVRVATAPLRWFWNLLF